MARGKPAFPISKLQLGCFKSCQPRQGLTCSSILAQPSLYKKLNIRFVFYSHVVVPQSKLNHAEREAHNKPARNFHDIFWAPLTLCRTPNRWLVVRLI